MDDDSLHSLLSRGRLSGEQRERALAGALERSGGRGRWYWAALALPAAAAVVLGIGLLRAPKADGPASAVFRAKGNAGPMLLASCPGRPAGECRVGDRLVFEIEDAQEPGFFAAYAECASRERIWYFPTASGMLPEIVPNQTRSVLRQASRIGSEHGVGSCKLHLFALKQQASRAELIAGSADRSRADLMLEVKP